MITRKEVVNLCLQHIGGLLETALPVSEQIERQQDDQAKFISNKTDPLDALMAQPNDPSYTRGWNQVKRGLIT